MRIQGVGGSNSRKVLSYYRVNFDLNPPFQVLCDGPTIYLSLKNGLYLKQSLPRLLGSTAYPVVTQCIVDELRSLGDDYASATLFAKRVTRIPCAHEGKLSASECVISRLKKPMEKKLLLATTDNEVLGKVVRIPGVLIISVSNQTKLVLRPPSKATMLFVRKAEKEKGKVLPESDRKLVEDVQAAEMAMLMSRKRLGKRKRAKGPNPLSMKKTKKTPATQMSHEETHTSNEQSSPAAVSFSKSLDLNSSLPEQPNPKSKSEAEVSGIPSNMCPSEGRTPTQSSKRRRRRKQPSSIGELQKERVEDTKAIDSHLERSDAHVLEGHTPRRKRRRKTSSSKRGTVLGTTKNNSSTGDQKSEVLKDSNEVESTERRDPHDPLKESKTEKALRHNILPTEGTERQNDEIAILQGLQENTRAHSPRNNFSGHISNTRNTPSAADGSNGLEENRDPVRPSSTKLLGTECGTNLEHQNGKPPKKKKQRKNRRRRPEKVTSSQIEVQ